MSLRAGDDYILCVDGIVGPPWPRGLFGVGTFAERKERRREQTDGDDNDVAGLIRSEQPRYSVDNLEEASHNTEEPLRRLDSGRPARKENDGGKSIPNITLGPLDSNVDGDALRKRTSRRDSSSSRTGATDPYESTTTDDWKGPTASHTALNRATSASKSPKVATYDGIHAIGVSRPSDAQPESKKQRRPSSGFDDYETTEDASKRPRSVIVSRSESKNLGDAIFEDAVLDVDDIEEEVEEDDDDADVMGFRISRGPSGANTMRRQSTGTIAQSSTSASSIRNNGSSSRLFDGGAFVGSVTGNPNSSRGTGGASSSNSVGSSTSRIGHRVIRGKLVPVPLRLAQPSNIVRNSGVQTSMRNYSRKSFG